MFAEMLSADLRDIVQTDEVLVRALSIHPTLVIRIGELQFEKSVYLDAARAAVNGRQGKARAWRSRDEFVFSPAEGGIRIKGLSGPELNVNDPMLGLLSEKLDQRRATLSAHPGWVR